GRNFARRAVFFLLELTAQASGARQLRECGQSCARPTIPSGAEPRLASLFPRGRYDNVIDVVAAFISAPIRRPLSDFVRIAARHCGIIAKGRQAWPPERRNSPALPSATGVASGISLTRMGS